MKKLLILLMLPILLIPMVVKADMQILHSYYNEKVFENGEVQVNIPVSYDKEYNWVITYDATKLRTDESMITISPDTTYKIVNDEPKEQSNLKQVKVSNGKITIKVKMDSPEGIIDDDTVPVVVLRFTAVKEGETNIKIESNDHDFIVSPTVKISKAPVTNCIEIDTTKVPEEEQEKEQEQEPTNTEEKPKENEKENKDMLFYISLGANGLLLITVIVLIFMNKSKKNKIVE